MLCLLNDMTENIPLAIGKQSSGEAFIINICALPNLFITYSNDFQLQGIFISFIQRLHQQDPALQFALSLSSLLAEQVKPCVQTDAIFIEFLHNDATGGKINSVEEFITALRSEMKKRQALLRKKADYSLRLPSLIVFIDDIFEVLKSKHKKTVLAFIELLTGAVNCNMYFILGSSGIYRNLLNQVINLNPALQEKLQRPGNTAQITQPLGAELVINPDGLLFFREKGRQIHTRLYPESV